MEIISSDEGTVSKRSVHFLDLPQEVRDMIYAYFPYLASIHVNQDPEKVLQPSISKVCHRIRKESLDVFYGRNKFFLDLRGWKHASYPRKWTPQMVLERWINAIGDENAARIRSLSFFSYSFRLNVKISNDTPPTLTLRFRTTPTRVEVAEFVPSWYTFDVAAARAEKGLKQMLQDIETKTQERPLNVDDFITISRAVENVQPFLCKRMSLGYKGAVLLKDDMSVEEWPNAETHLEKCDECGYHRFNRGTGDASY